MLSRNNQGAQAAVKPTMVRFHPKLHKKLRTTAFREGCSMNSLVNLIVKDWALKRKK
jgi:predicted HicB family RNase H-like nuclease